MKKLTELLTVSTIVRELLESIPETRNDDCFLYVLVCNRINPFSSTLNFADALINRQHYNLPTPETVRRTRQKMQAEFPDLAGSRKCREARKELEADFREYARCEHG